ncbi:MAG: nuclear transport factor 2 family protein [Thermomicrobium sp.]|nr:nuclear transport factor 2 family protein [Thermomicrobium sp.]
MSGEAREPIDVVRTVLAALNRGDLETALRYCADEIVLWAPGPTPEGTELRGKDALRAFLEASEFAWPDSWAALRTVVASGEEVAVELVATATHGGERVTQPMAAFFTVRDGLIVRQACYFDLAGLLVHLRERGIA